MDKYKEQVAIELQFWKMEVTKEPSLFNNITEKVQRKINSYIPQKVHDGITAAIKQMIRAVLFGSEITSSNVAPTEMSFLHREALVKSKIKSYCKTGAAEGGITGAGGFLMSLADFPLLIAIKIKLLYEIAALYGFNVSDFRERLYILHIFQLTFSSKKGVQQVFTQIENWDEKLFLFPENGDGFDWQTFQQQYRDYIDLAKLAQLLPVFGAAVGAVANYQLIKKLGKTAMMCYRMRILKDK